MTNYDDVAAGISERISRSQMWDAAVGEVPDFEREWYGILLARLAIAVGDEKVVALFSNGSFDRQNEHRFIGEVKIFTETVMISATIDRDAMVYGNLGEVELSVVGLNPTSLTVTTTKNASADTTWPGRLQVRIQFEGSGDMTLPLSNNGNRGEHDELLALLPHLKRALARG